MPSDVYCYHYEYNHEELLFSFVHVASNNIQLASDQLKPNKEKM